MKPSYKLRGEYAFIFEDIIDKSLAILSRQFNVDIRFVENPKLVSHQLYKTNIIENNLITYSVNFENIFRGQLELHFTDHLNLKEIDKIRDFLNLSIKAPAQYYERFLLLDSLQAHLEKQKHSQKNNILNFNYFKHLKERRNSSDDDINYIKKSHPPIYIEGLSVEDKKNLAIELHHFLGYKAFVHFDDIKSEIKSCRDLAQLSNTTIYIENFETLEQEHKLIFLDFFTEQNLPEQPLVISSSNTDYAFLIRDILNRTLLKFLTTYHIRMNKTLDEIKKEGFTTFLNSILKDPKIFTTH